MTDLTARAPHCLPCWPDLLVLALPPRVITTSHIDPVGPPLLSCCDCAAVSCLSSDHDSKPADRKPGNPGNPGNNWQLLPPLRLACCMSCWRLSTLHATSTALHLRSRGGLLISSCKCRSQLLLFPSVQSRKRLFKARDTVESGIRCSGFRVMCYQPSSVAPPPSRETYRWGTPLFISRLKTGFVSQKNVGGGGARPLSSHSIRTRHRRAECVSYTV